MDSHRLIHTVGIEFLQISRPFSSFNYVEDNFGDCDSLRRLFSLARSHEAKTLLVEKIDAAGIIKSENDTLFLMFPDHSSEGVFRLSFWNTEIRDLQTLKTSSDDNMIGYCILKHDSVPVKKKYGWHVFEAVFKKYSHHHNCIPSPKTYTVTISQYVFRVTGVLYCQQNQLNKACAHVALRTLLSRIVPAGDVSYEEINSIAQVYATPDWQPSEGLCVQQIRAILIHFKIKFRDIDYSQSESAITEIPFQKLAYSGIESGVGSLIGFELTGSDIENAGRHIIPVYGHTFNQDTWAPDADVAYFHIGENMGYIPSESWTSSFLGHDDNFGPNFCIPRLYIKPEQVKYVIELLSNGVEYSGIQAEAYALSFLYSVMPSIQIQQNRWLERLREWTKKQKIVLRAQAVTREKYISHLRTIDDWDWNNENPKLCDLLIQQLPEVLWMVEVSTPQLFPSNERKLGEIILDATQPISSNNNGNPFNIFIFIRLPSCYFFGHSINVQGKPTFVSVLSNIKSHTPLYRIT